jgi:hypothetical protein
MFKDIQGPELASLMNAPPVGVNWIHEIKYDGYRTIGRKDKSKDPWTDFFKLNQKINLLDQYKKTK